MSDRGEIAAIASRTPGKAAAMAAPYGAVRLHDSYEALLADPGVDAIYIPLPNHQHVEWTAKCLEAGKHVLCEKPIALRAEEIDGLIALRDRTGLVAAEAFMVTHHPQWIRARELVAEGAIGTLRQVQGAFSFFNDDPGNIRNRADLAGGALRDIGVYPCISHALRHRGGAGRGALCHDRVGRAASTPPRGWWRSSRASAWTSTSRCAWRRGR